jgi:hypothetical protein
MNKTYKILVSTQFLENYAEPGAAPYWKCKGGSDYIVLMTDAFEGTDWDSTGFRASLDFVEESLNEFLPNNEFGHEYVIGVSLMETARMPWSEAAQLKYDGEVKYFEPVFVVDRDLVTGMRTFREATSEEISAYRAQLEEREDV